MEDSSKNGLEIETQTIYDGKQQIAGTIINNHKVPEDITWTVALTALASAVGNIIGSIFVSAFNDSDTPNNPK